MLGCLRQRAPGRPCQHRQDERKRKAGLRVSYPPNSLVSPRLLSATSPGTCARPIFGATVTEWQFLRFSICLHEACIYPYNPPAHLQAKLLLTITYFCSFAVSRWDRLLVFGGLNLAALAMFATCFALMFTPIFLVKPRKFAIL